MAPRPAAGARRREILEALAELLATPEAAPVTTAALARAVGLSEAALYRHFPSKARIFEGLLEFAEGALFERIRALAREVPDTPAALGQMAALALAFAERNPGIARLLAGEVLVGEDPRLGRRAARVFERLAAEFRQRIRRGEVEEERVCALPPGMAAALVADWVVGRWQRYVKSGFAAPPTADWGVVWALMGRALFPPPGSH
ncbi:MAG: nucleoid occlusion factor SlmA [Porticoccaceae bacterium]|nr:MAG: nucleoid occlusion factor SlmA [Porticoccaceae bacterium]